MQNLTKAIANSSKEAHEKQRALAKQRKQAKPNADTITHAKKLWEKLRIKSSVPKEERKKLVEELLSVISGRVKDFVFKHDSVRPVQCALKYATPDQRKEIALELQGEYKTLAESRYAKFLVAKILEGTGPDIQEMVVSEFCGNVRRLINHPEASWILDDTYRQVATPKQKATLLREWYGPEFSVFKSPKDKKLTANVLDILKETPEKRQPIVQYLHGLINQLIQKKTHGFTMLHDAMLQYSLAISTPPSLDHADILATANSSAHVEWLELLKPTEEEDLDLMKNLAFTASGCRVVARALALAPSAKDRKLLLRPFKDIVETLACDTHGANVIVAAYECIDDTVLLAKFFFPDLLASKTVDVEERANAVAALGTHPIGRMTILWPLTYSDEKLPRWLVNPNSEAGLILEEVRGLRAATSKKQPSARRAELAKALVTTADNAMLSAIERCAEQLAADSFGCQFMTETMLAAEQAQVTSSNAAAAIASLAEGNPSEDGHIGQSAAGCRMLKALIQRGRFNPKTKAVDKFDGSAKGLRNFPGQLWPHVSEYITQWATGEGSFVVVALCEDEDWSERKLVLGALRKIKKELQGAANAVSAAVSVKDEEEAADKKSAGNKKKAVAGGNAGSRLLLQMI